MRKKVLVLGSTGSIGRAALEVIDHENESLQVFGLACRNQTDLLNSQIRKFKPEYVCVYDETQGDAVRMGKGRLLSGAQGMKEMTGMDCDIVLNALPGSIGLEPTIAALRNKKTLALANKESLIMAGRIIMDLTSTMPRKLIPVDSEHSALHQLLSAMPRKEVSTLIITASGGPFRNHKKEDLKNVKPEQALRHPTWKMGQKITLDSATLMNKGLEVIEARWLFNMDPRDIRVLIHPESIIHGIVELTDSSLMAYMAYPDMKIPIAYALNDYHRMSLPVRKLILEDIGSLSFHSPDLDTFPALKLAYDALFSGDSALIALNTANEVASQAFIGGKIRFTDIPRIVEEALAHHPQQNIVEDLDTVWHIHDLTEAYARTHITELTR
ncbi:MAG TPA: 1-deoxy-D-xylulose-5-phosphate reductoisomerase [Syntrophorhabdaceae bacterium]|nr:1-deoxy-D-xylulose-5-phosphate reductoisomerase [Syntrophorhabdaceae bacterium]